MHYRNALGVIGLTLAATCSVAQAFDDTKYPELWGQWIGVRIPGVGGQPAFDPTKPWGRGQQAPLTPEYQAVLEASLAGQARGGQGNWKPGADCLPPGMPAMMTLYQAAEFIVLPEITYIRIDHVHDSHRRIYTDGRDWPKEVEPTFLGYSIVKERLVFDRTKPDILRNDITLIDNAYTRPWSVSKTYRRLPIEHQEWLEYNCAGDNELIRIGEETYYRGGDGHLMPTRKDQPPPDLRYFKQTRK